jgi:arylsulfatase A-like enzyme
VRAESPGSGCPARRNILLVVVDQWRGDILPWLGTPVLRTPNLDRLCREGVTFRNHFSQAAPCGPARASLLTSLYQMTHRAVQNTIPLDARFTNLGYELAAAGYDPAFIGYTTTTPDPRKASPKDPRFFVLGGTMDGFRQIAAFEPGKDEYFGWVERQGFELPAVREDIWLPQGKGSPGATPLPASIPAGLSDTAWFTERALEHLAGVRARPWFLHLGYYRPHPPFVAPAPYHAMYDPADMPPPVRAASVEADAAQHPLLAYYVEHVMQDGFFQNGVGKVAAMSEAELRQTRATYYGLMSELDDQLGRVFRFLDETGQWNDTLIVFTSDHGEQLGDHHLLGKLGYFDASFRVPLILRDPAPAANATRGRIVEEFTEAVDVMPTVLEWLGAKIPRQCVGRSLLPFAHGRAPVDWRREAHYEFDFRDIYYSAPERWLGVAMDRASLAVVQDRRFKYVHFAALPPLLFDLGADPGEFRNLAPDVAHATIVRDYAQKMLDWRLGHAEKTLTGYRATPRGLEARA